MCNSILCNNCFYSGLCPGVEKNKSLEGYLCSNYMDYEEFYEQEEFSSHWLEMSYARYIDNNCLETELELEIL